MSTRDEWIISQAAPSLKALEGNTRRCHLDDAITLCHYLNGEISAKSTAQLITTIARREAIDNPTHRTMTVFRIMRLLVECLIHLDQGEMLLNLLLTIQDLPSDGSIYWWKLPTFASLWIQWSSPLHIESGDERNIAYFKKAGHLEATMYVRGISGVEEKWGHDHTNLVCLEREEFEYDIHQVHQWLIVAGSKLAKNLQPAQVKAFDRAVRGRRDKTYMIEATMYEHWEHWKKRFLQVSHDEDFLSPESRQVAKECYEIMKGLVVEQPDPPVADVGLRPGAKT